MRCPRLSAALLFLLVACAVTARAGESSDPLFYDYAAIQKLASDGLTAAAAGTYEVWLWGKGPELAITIGETELKTKSERFGWQHAGQVKLDPGQKAAVRLPGEATAENLTNIPGYLALSPRADFDPKRTPLGAVRTLYDGSGFQPSTSKDEWLKRREALRRQILISTGMWPMPPRSPLHAQIYGKQVRDGYTIEKVVLETFPNFYLSGNLYRPAPWVPAQNDTADLKARKDAWEQNRSAEKKPGILCPHGHWRDGRFEPEVQRRSKQLARMGAVVFSYDMVGRADSKPFGHEFLDPQLDLMGFSLLALQTWDSIRALDFLTSLPDVDTDRVACTGASGGGTQTFILSAIDDRVRVAAPVVMVSQDMQGGCACENASGLRIGTDNSEIAALFAPKPQIFVGAHDWTWEFMTKGFPEIQATYKLFDAADRVEADVFDFPHNYNQTSRERVYAFFAKTLFAIDPALSKEMPVEPEAFETISTWDADHPRPANAVDAAGLKKYLAGMVAEQALEFRPTTKEAWGSKRQELADALAHRLALNVPALRVEKGVIDQRDNVTELRFGAGPTPRVRGLLFAPPDGKEKTRTLVVHPNGVAGLMGDDGKPAPLVKDLLARGQTVLVIDPFGIGGNTNPFAAAATQSVAQFSCYNRTTAAERVQDIVRALGLLAEAGKEVHLVGLGSAGPLCLIARTQTPFVARTIIDANQFDYRADSDLTADQVLPGIVRLGGLRAVGCLAAPGRLALYNTGNGLDTNWIEEAYRIEGAESKLIIARGEASPEQIVGWLSE